MEHDIARSALARRRRGPAWLRWPSPFWVAAMALAATTAVGVGQAVAGADAARQRWGALEPALVATAPVAAGGVLGPATTELRRLPRMLVPPGALSSPADGAVATTSLHPGEIVLGARLAPDGLSPTAAMLPSGTRGVAVPTGPGALALDVGDMVDVLAADPATGEVATVTRGAMVVAAGEESVTVAVAAGQAPAVALAVLAGVATLTLVGA